MNYVNQATDDVSNTKTYFELAATMAPTNSRRTVADSGYPLSTADHAANHPLSQMRPDWRVREDRNFYVPDLLSDKNHDTDRQAYAAADDYAAHLRNAERLVCQAEDLVGLMRAAIHYESDARAMQAETALAVIEKKLCKAHSTAVSTSMTGATRTCFSRTLILGERRTSECEVGFPHRRMRYRGTAH